MNEKHPIDELYRRTLHDAEVPPPPQVWEGIVRARRSRRRAWWPWAMAAIVVIGAGGAWWMAHDEGGVTPSTIAQPRPQAARTPMTTTAATEPLPGTPAEQGTDAAGTRDAERPAAGPSSHNGTSTAYSQGPDQGLSTRPDAPTATDRNGRQEDRVNLNAGLPGTTPAAPMAPPRYANPPGAHPEVLATDKPHHLALRPSPSLAQTTPPVLRKAGQVSYVLPKVERWLALELGRHDVDRTWQGSDNTLVDALNAIEVPHPTWSAGGVFGWRWRSGLGLSVGAAYEGSRYEFDHVESTLNVDSIVQQAYLVTLDTQVFVSSTTTTVYGTSEETRVSGSNSLGVLVLPVEAYWHHPVKRWTFGVRAGLQGELTVTRRGYTLVHTTDEGPQSALIDDDAFDARYAPVISGSVAGDVGYLLAERWGIWLSPGYVRGIAAIGTTDQPWSLPERFSLRMRLSYSFSRTP